MNKLLKVGIVGAGLIGNKRAIAVKKIGGGEVVAVADTDVSRGEKLASECQAKFYKNWKDLLNDKNIEVVVVAVPNVFICPIVVSALKNGKHVICEKPFGINSKEALKMLRASKKFKKLIKVGFNYRFHPGIVKAKELVDQGAIGRVMFIRARHGHGGRTGMEKEWRLNKKISGGGELLDQGVHMIDLARWFGGEFVSAYGVVDTKFWKTEVDDNAFAILKNKKVTASIHVSTTNWGNIFSLEIFGVNGAITIEGMGRRYGQETLRVGLRKEPFNDLEVETSTYPSEVDESWEEEWKNLLLAINKKGKIIGDATDGYKANLIVDALYKSSKLGRAIHP